SISTGEGDPAQLERAAAWVVERVRGAGGEGRLVTIDGGNPLAVGELRAADPAAPTVLIYGHYDVQSPGAPDAWTSPPFEPTVRVGLRGLVHLHVRVRTGERDLHSGLYGGAALNAAHVLHAMLAAVVPAPGGRVRDELRAGIVAPADAERASWARLKPGEQVL